MSRDVREKAFEPFFTTKEQGKGTGLGLSMVYGFAKQSGGHAAIESEDGKGTVVSIYLPRHRADGEASGLGGAADPAQAGAGQLIVAVEDDERVRRLTVSRLTQLGYRVLPAGSGAEALQILATEPEVHLLFTDLVMPGGMSGYELSTVVRSLYPDIRVLLTSGYAEELAKGDHLAAEQFKVLRKPYRQAELAAAIEDVLKG
jgi:CheY-like chemotaxis protein